MQSLLWMFILSSAALLPTVQPFIPAWLNSASNNNTADRFSESGDALLSTFFDLHRLGNFDEAKSRNKRSLSEPDNSFRETLGSHRLRLIKPQGVVCDRAIDIVFITFSNQQYVICVSERSTTKNSFLHVGILKNLQEWTILASTSLILPQSVVVFSGAQRIYIVVADTGYESGTALYFYDPSKQGIFVDHNIHSANPTAVAFWRMQSSGDYNLALANSGTDISTSIYAWRDTYFDKYAQVSSLVVRDLEPFSIHNHDYLVVVNERHPTRDHENSHETVNTYVYKYDIGHNAWRLFQQIATDGATDAEHFTLGTDRDASHFLAIAHQYERHGNDRYYQTESVIYVFKANKFVPFQSLDTVGATKISSYSGVNGEFLLAVSSLFEPVKLFQYTGWQFVPAAVQYTQHSMGPRAHNINFYSLHTNRVIMAVSNPASDGGVNIFELEFYLDDALLKWYKSSTAWCNEAVKLSNFGVSAAMTARLNDVFFTDSQATIRLPGDITVRDLHVREGVRADEMQELVSGHVVSVKDLEELEALEKEVIQLTNKITSIIGDLQMALRLKGDQTVSGGLTFGEVDLQCRQPKSLGMEISELDTMMLNGRSVVDLGYNVVFTDRDITLHRPITFSRGFSVEGSGSIAGKLASHNISDFVTLHGNHEIVASSTEFASNLALNLGLIARDYFGGVKFSPDFLLLTEGDQRLEGHYTFNDLSVADINVSGRYNGLNVARWLNSVVTTHGKHRISGRKTFNSIAVDNVLWTEQLNDVDLKRLFEETLWTNKNDQVVTAPFDFSTVATTNVVLNGTLNGLRIPGPDIIHVTQNAVITAPKRFTKHVRAHHLMVHVSINGIDRIRNSPSPWKGQLDIMLRSVPQHIFAPKSFEQIYVDRKSGVKGMVDGEKLGALVHQLAARSSAAFNGSLVVNGDVEFAEGVRVGGLVNRRRISQLYYHTLPLNATSFPAYHLIVFDNNLAASSLTAKFMNGFELPSSFILNRRGIVPIRGDKTFRHMVLAGPNVLVKGFLNGVGRNVISDTLTRGRPESVSHIDAPKHVIGSVLRARNLIIRNSVNGVNIREFCILNEGCMLSGSKYFEALVVRGNSRIHRLFSHSTINGVSTPQMLDNTLFHTVPQVVRNVVIVLGNTTVIKEGNLLAKNVSGVDITYLANEAVRLHTNDVISAPKMFIHPARFSRLNMYTTVDGVSNGDMLNWMLDGVDQTIYGELVLAENGHILSNINVEGGINGVNLNQLAKSIVYRDRPHTFKHSVELNKVGVSGGEVGVGGWIQGVDLSREVVTIAGDALIGGRKTFLSGFTAVHDLRLRGTLDSVRVEALCAQALMLRPNAKGGATVQRLTAPLVIKGDVHFEKDLTYGGLMDGVSLKSLYDSCLRTKSDLASRGTKHFKHLVIDGPVTIRGLINGIYVDNLNSNYMSLTRQQRVRATLSMPHVHFDGSLKSGNIDAHLVNNVNLPLWQNLVLNTRSNQRLNTVCHMNSTVFLENVKIGGGVNGIKVPDDLMVLGRSNSVISSPLRIVGSTGVENDLSMPNEAKLQGVDIPRWIQGVVLNDHRTYVVDGHKRFKYLHAPEMRIGGKLNNVRVTPDDILLASGSQIIRGQKSFTKPFKAERLFAPKGISGIDLADFKKRVVLHGRNNTFIAPQRIVGPLKTKHLYTDVIDAAKFEPDRSLLREIDVLGRNLRAQQRYANRLARAFASQALVMSYYEKVFALTSGSALAWGYAHLRSNDELFFLSLSPTVVSECNPFKVFHVSGDTLEKAQEDLLVSRGTKTYHMVVNNEDLVCVMSMRWMDGCIQGLPEVAAIGEGDSGIQVFRWDPKQRHLVFYQAIKFRSIRDVVPVSDGGCLAATGIGGTHLYCIDTIDKGFHLSEKISDVPGERISASSCFLHKSAHRSIIAVSIVPPNRRNPSTVALFQRIYHHGVGSTKDSSRYEAVQSLQAIAVSSVLVVGHLDTCAVFVGQQRVEGTALPLAIYRIDSSMGVRLSQKAMIGAVEGLEYVLSPDDRNIHVFVNTDEGRLHVMIMKGASGFVTEDSLDIKGFTNCRVFQRPLDGSHFVTLVDSQGEYCEANEQCSSKNTAVVLMAKVRGIRQYDQLTNHR